MIHVLAMIVALHTHPPKAIQEPTVPTEATCDWAFDHHTKDAADICLETADSWARYAEIHSHRSDINFIEILEALTRLQTSRAMMWAHRGSDALGQMELAVSISQSVAQRTTDPHIIQFVNIIANEAVKAYPKVWKKVSPTVP